MSNINNPLSAASYTNKDFQSIYVELLEAAKSLAKNWDPTISNESDPGVVLLKLNAIIADKNNYNIDKNTLENYPETYTQELSARSQYRQLGYKMPWYKAATTNITFKWIGEKLQDGDRMSIPKYTMVMDKEGKYVFTILQPVTLGKITNEAFDHYSVPAIQGIITTLKLAGSTNITLANLDSNNRLYINDHYIAQNGIYITSSSDPNGICWERVDNVELKPFGSNCYEFDIDPRRNCPYIQFPDDIKSTIGDGLTVKYIVTNGYSGNVGAKVIDTFFDQSTIEIIHANLETTSINLTADNFLIYNKDNTVGGQDPESLEAAAKSFKKEICTFDTLVTLRDYMNAIYLFGKETNLLSNVIVTDRTNDIQSSYRIIDKNDGLLGYLTHEVGEHKISISNVPVDVVSAIQEKKDIEDIKEDIEQYISENVVKPDVEIGYDPEMSAYDLKFYVLKSGGLLNDIASFNSSFDIDNSSETKINIQSRIQDSKAIAHDVVDIKPFVPFMLQNVYPINIKLVPTYKLNDVAQRELVNNIKKALIQTLNSRMCEFGEEPSYDIIYNEILSSDERIKVLILDDLKYTTFAVYLGYTDNDVSGDPEFKYIPISDYSTCSRLIVRDSLSCDACGSPLRTVGSVDLSIKEKLQQAANRILKEESNSLNAKPTKKQIDSYRFIDATNGIMYCWKETTKGAEHDPSEIQLYSARLLDIRAEVIAKNILAGVTPLFDYEVTTFNTTLDMNKLEDISGDVDHVSTKLEIAPFGFDATYSGTGEKRSASYKLRANESLRFTAPSFISDRTYANYVKFELVLKNPILSNSQFTWADPEDEEEIVKNYGRTSFYKQVDTDVYTPLYGSKYVPLTDIPRFKLLYHANVERGSGPRPEPINNTECYRPYNGKISDVKWFTPEFETNVYYYIEDGQYKVINQFPPEFQHNLSDGKYYRLKHYCRGLVTANINELTPWKEGKYFYPMTVENSDQIQALDELQFDYVNDSTHQHWMIYKLYESGDYITTDNIIDGEGPFYIEVVTDFQKKHFNQNNGFVQLSADDLTSLKYVFGTFGNEGSNIYIKDNICDVANINVWDRLNSEDSNDRFKPATPILFNTYIRMYDDQKHLVGYYPIELTDNDDLDEIAPSGILDKTKFENLIKREFTNVNKDLGYNYIFDINTDVVIATEPSNWKTQYKEKYKNKYLNTSSGVNIATISAPPDYTTYVCLEYDKENNKYERVIKNNAPNNWVDVFDNYFHQESYAGLDITSPEYLQWKKGELSLYVRKASYKLAANTEYQLRKDDYIVFFWRNSDEDDAPYTYRKYDHIYDNDTGEKTIIKASFPINASSISTRLFNHDKLNPSGEIIYDDAASSDFQIINKKMYGDYDLSGSRQIELRKMNSVKVSDDDKKYYYFISAEKEKVEGYNSDVFTMLFTAKRTWEDINGNKYAKYQRILQPGEYFAYLNKDQTLFEILGEETLIEYNMKIDDSFDLKANNTITFTVNAIDSTEILYRGIEALKECCKTIGPNENFKIVEQQIYSFVKDDVIQITLNDSIGFNYIEADDLSDATHLLKYKFDRVPLDTSTEVTKVPKFVTGEYYSLPDKLQESDAKFKNYTIVTKEPDNWNDINAWKANTLRFYKLAYADYIKITAETTDKEKKTLEKYVREDPKYPVFNGTNPVLMKDFGISYSAASNNNSETNQLDLVYTTLPVIDVEDEDYGWNVTAHLNIMTDMNEPQKVEVSSDNNTSRQYITVKGKQFPTGYDKESAYYELEGIKKYLEKNKDELYILSSSPLDKVGSDYIDVTYVDLLGERHDIELFTYQFNSLYVNSYNGWKVADNGIVLSVPEKTNSLEKEIRDIKLSSLNKHLLPVLVPDEGVTNFSIIDTTDNKNEKLKCVCCQSDTFGPGKHFIELPADIKSIKIVVNNTMEKESANILFENLFKYNYRELFGGDFVNGAWTHVPKYGIDTNMLLQKISELDVNGDFKYTHIPDKDQLIIDPLDPVSLFDSNHVYNQFSIARAEIDSSKPYDASFDIVNNK